MLWIFWRMKLSDLTHTVTALLHMRLQAECTQLDLSCFAGPGAWVDTTTLWSWAGCCCLAALSSLHGLLCFVPDLDHFSAIFFPLVMKFHWQLFLLQITFHKRLFCLALVSRLSACFMLLLVLFPCSFPNQDFLPEKVFPINKTVHLSA